MAKKIPQKSSINPKLINRLIEQKKFHDARKVLDHILKIQKNNDLAHYYLGRIDFETKRFDEALQHLTIAQNSMSNYQNLHLILFNIYSAKNDVNLAIQSLQHALEINNQDDNLIIQYLYYLYLHRQYQMALEYAKKVESKLISNKQFCNMFGLIYRELGDFESAAQYFTKAIQLDPNYFEVFDNMAFIYLQTGQHQEAVNILHKCIELCPQYTNAYIALANNYLALDMLKPALTYIKKAYELSPNHKDALALFVQIVRYACDWQQVETLSPKLDECIQQCIEAHNLIPERPWLNVTRTQDKEQNYLVAKNSMDLYVFPRIASYHQDYQFQLNTDKKIKIGYFSCDLYDHPTMHLIGNLFKYHNRDLFEVHVFSYGPIKPEDPYYQQAKNTADYFYDMPDEGFKKMADFIYQKNIDILIDLKGYTKGAKLEVMALKPAPILIQYLGYPGTMGTDKYDYIITDKTISPITDEKYFAENFIYLPHTYQVTDNLQIIADKVFTRKDFNLPEDAIILSTFNNSFKLDKSSFSIWLDILAKHEKVILWIYEPNDFVRQHLIDFAKNYNNTENRIHFAPKLKKAEHLARIKIVDLMLDTFTCNGHTTTTDALWSGVPVMTLLGKHFASRVSASILKAMDLSELVATSETEYADKISFYCQNPDELNKLKQKIEQNRLTSPLFQSEQFAGFLDKALVEVFQRHRDGLPPEHIDITSDN